MLGGHAPYPKRYGGGRPPLKIIHDSLNAARGTALDASDSTTVAWVENMAFARAICFDGFGTNERLGNQWDPDRMTDMLGRWEDILAIFPAPTATGYDRRQAIRARFRRFLASTSIHSRLVNVLTLALGTYFTAIEYIGFTHAVIHVPDTTYPWGTVADGVPWSSSVAHILILLTVPIGTSDGEFYDTAAKVGPAVDGIIPAWCTWDWYREPAAGPPVFATDGPSKAGIYLDNEHNLDNSVFDADGVSFYVLSETALTINAENSDRLRAE